MIAAKSSIVVIGSSNTDMVVRSKRLPGPGETILGGHFFMNAGGKGANQAVAAARLGGAVTFIAKAGKDIFGDQALELFRREGIDTSFIKQDKNYPSGVALIIVDDKAENCIVVAPGANAALLPSDLDFSRAVISHAAVVLVQLEIPLETVEHAAALVDPFEAILILNPAPANTIANELLEKVDIITPNETEATLLTGIQVHDQVTAEAAARKLLEKGVGSVVITMGAKGAYWTDGKSSGFCPAPQVKAVDTTAAGDVFNGALALAIAEEMEFPQAVAFGCAAASLSVTRLGAQASAPFRKELNQ
ncbi:MAG: ribokinase [Chitinophagales bacterium]